MEARRPSPATAKFTFVWNQEVADLVIHGASLYGTDPAIYDSDGNLISHGDKSRAEFGALFTAALQKDIMKNVNLATKLSLFNSYQKNTDINYDLYLNMKVNKWITASFFTNIIYDNDVIIKDYNEDGSQKGTAGPRTQVKEGFGVGLTYKFGDQK